MNIWARLTILVVESVVAHDEMYLLRRCRGTGTENHEATQDGARDHTAYGWPFQHAHNLLRRVKRLY